MIDITVLPTYNIRLSKEYVETLILAGLLKSLRQEKPKRHDVIRILLNKKGSLKFNTNKGLLTDVILTIEHQNIKEKPNIQKRAKGGINRAKKLTKERRSEIAKLGANARWNSVKISTPAAPKRPRQKHEENQ